MRRFDVIVDGISKSVDESLLTFDSEGRVYKHYNADMSLSVKDIQADIDSAIAKKVKDAKVDALDALQVTHNTVAYDANGRAIGNMSAVMGVANFKYNQGCKEIEDFNMSNTEMDILTKLEKIVVEKQQLYTKIYKDTKISWKGADDKIHSVMIESVCEALEASMLEVAKIVVV